jgi:hypothetical protein
MSNALFKAAAAAPHADRKRGEKSVRTTDMWMPAVIELRRKNYSYAEIHAFLKSHGEDVHDSVATFASAVGRRLRRWQDKQLRKARR